MLSPVTAGTRIQHRRYIILPTMQLSAILATAPLDTIPARLIRRGAGKFWQQLGNGKYAIVAGSDISYLIRYRSAILAK
ncbi:hypothetical protein [Chitinilyticum piscinae]|nr:hypothetical protein [Chitinilyticum piscinae]